MKAGKDESSLEGKQSRQAVVQTGGGQDHRQTVRNRNETDKQMEVWMTWQWAQRQPDNWWVETGSLKHGVCGGFGKRELVVCAGQGCCGGLHPHRLSFKMHLLRRFHLPSALLWCVWAQKTETCGNTAEPDIVWKLEGGGATDRTETFGNNDADIHRHLKACPVYTITDACNNACMSYCIFMWQRWFWTYSKYDNF